MRNVAEHFKEKMFLKDGRNCDENESYGSSKKPKENRGFFQYSIKQKVCNFKAKVILGLF